MAEKQTKSSDTSSAKKRKKKPIIQTDRLFSDSTERFLRNNKTELKVALVVFLVLWLIFDISGFGGNIRFYAKWIECGRKPVVSGFSYKGPIHYVEAEVFKPVRLSPRQFCTPLEAEQAGYSADPTVYDFPHIKKAREEGGIQ